MATNADIQWWLANHPNATDQERRAAMDQFGVNQFQVADATGVSLPEVTQRYNATTAPNTGGGAPVPATLDSALPPGGFPANGGPVPDGANALMQRLYRTPGQGQGGAGDQNALMRTLTPRQPRQPKGYLP